MKIKHDEILISENNPFEHCKLGREKYADALTNIVDSYRGGFVLAINNEWGTGKTTFVKMWRQHLTNSGFKSVYFNAWENDFDSSPLVGIISEIKDIVNDSNDKIYKSVVEKGAVLTKNILPALLKAVAKKYIDTEEIVDAIENVTKGATEILEEEIKEYANKKKAIIDFRIQLEKLVKNSDIDKPLVFIIDELDRCRPSYAVEVLEQLKHFFSVPGIVFILSIDKPHLASAVCGFYGSEKINTDEYLRRFIDLEYSIPKPSINEFCNYLFEYYSFKEFFSSKEREQLGVFRNDSEQFLKMATLIFTMSNSTLRQQEKIFGLCRLILKSFKFNNYVFPPLLFSLIFIKTMKSDLYFKIQNSMLSLQDLSDEFSQLMPADDDSSFSLNLIYLEALLLTFYNNQNYNRKVKLFELDAGKQPVSHIKSKQEGLNSRSLAQCFHSIKNQWDYSDIKLEFLLERINLLETIQVK